MLIHSPLFTFLSVLGAPRFGETNSSQPVFAPDDPQYAISSAAGSPPIVSTDPAIYFGNGLTSASFTYNFTSNTKMFSSTSLDYYHPTEGYNISSFGFDFIGLKTDYTINTETDFIDDNLFQLDRDKLSYAMSFRTENFSGLLSGFELRLNPTVQGSIFAEVWTSTWNSLLQRPEPNAVIGAFIGNTQGAGWDWIAFDGNLVFLNVSETYDQTYFICPYSKLSILKPYWAYCNDTVVYDQVDEGFALETGNGGVSWNNATNGDTIDFSVQNIVFSEAYPTPSQVDLRVNGTAVQNGDVDRFTQKSNGTWQGTNIGGNSEYIYFNFTTNFTQPISFDLMYNGSAVNDSRVETLCRVEANVYHVDWNVTFDMEMPASSFWQLNRDQLMNITIPSNWTIEEVYNYSNPIVYSTDTQGSSTFVYINDRTGSIVIECNGTNFVRNIFHYNWTDSTQYENYLMNDTLKVNASVNVESAIKANLTVFDPTNNSVYTNTTQIQNEVASFFPFQLINVSQRNGTHLLRVVWFNGTQVGMNLTSCYVYNDPTMLTLVNQNPSTPVEQGQFVDIQLYYNDTHTGEGIGSATISSNWTYSFLNTVDHHNGTYDLSLNTAFAPAGNHSINFTAVKPGYEQSIVFTWINITETFEKTNLTIEFISSPIYVNDTFIDNKYAIIKYVNASDGEGIPGAHIRTTPSWSESYFDAIDLSIENESARGLYKVPLQTIGTHAEISYGIRFYASKIEDGFGPSDNYTHILVHAIPTEIITSGYDNLTIFEGESTGISAYVVDAVHTGNPPVLNAEVNWTVNHSGQSGEMDLNIVIYEGLIDAPAENIPPGTYNVTIRSSAEDFESGQKNITLNVLPKWETYLNIQTINDSEIQAGRSMTIAVNITFSNASLDRSNRVILFNLTDPQNNSYVETRVTNQSGIALFEINPIPNITWIDVNVSYDGTEQIAANYSAERITILSPFRTKILINDTILDDELISGEIVELNVTIYYNSTEGWQPLSNENLKVELDYGFGQDESYILTTDQNGQISGEIDPPEFAGTLQVRVIFSGNDTFEYCQNFSKTFTISKRNVTVQLTSTLPAQIFVGMSITLQVRILYNETENPVVNKSVTFIFQFVGVLEIEQKAQTDVNGIATTTFQIPDSASLADFMVIVIRFEGDESVAFLETEAVGQVGVMTVSKLIFQNLWWIIILGAAISSIAVGYNYGIRRPRIRRRIKAMKKRARRLQDALNLAHLMVIHKESSAVVYSESFGEEIQADLIGGFMTAISAFQQEIKVKKKSSGIQDERGFELSYQNFKILLMDREWSRVSFILYESPSPEFREKARAFLEDFDREFAPIMKEFDGSMSPFKTINQKTSKYLDTDLAKPFNLASLSIRQRRKLNDMQQGIIHISSRQLEKKGLIRLAMVMETLKTARNEPDYVLYCALDDLIQEKILFPLTEEDARQVDMQSLIETAEKGDLTQETPGQPSSSQATTVKTPVEEMELGLEPGEVIALGLSEEEEERVHDEFKSMSSTNKRLVLNMYNGTPKDQKKKFLREFLKERKKLRKNLLKLQKEAEKLRKKGKKLEEFQKLEMIKAINEELGEEEIATQVATEIQELLTTFDSIKEHKQLRLKTATAEKHAEWHASKRDFLRAALFYRKAARFSLEVGNIDEATRLAELASEAEARD